VEIAELADELCKKAGMPIRPGSKGYKMPRFIRIGVRKPEEQELLITALHPIKQKINKKTTLTKY